MLRLYTWQLEQLLAEEEPLEVSVPPFVPRRVETVPARPHTRLPADVQRIESLDVLARLAMAAESHDPYTAHHLESIQRYATCLAEALGCKPGYVREIELAALTHDVGKIGVAKRLLTRNGALDVQEKLEMQQHPLIGERLLTMPGMEMAREVCRSHHERWDGSGYPDGLSGAGIPLSARIVSVADVFDALTSKRAYKHAWTMDAALEHIERLSGTHFDPTIAGVFLKIAPQWQAA